jgi:hypothetical protein
MMMDGKVTLLKIQCLWALIINYSPIFISYTTSVAVCPHPLITTFFPIKAISISNSTNIRLTFICWIVLLLLFKDSNVIVNHPVGNTFKGCTIGKVVTFFISSFNFPQGWLYFLAKLSGLSHMSSLVEFSMIGGMH